MTTDFLITSYGLPDDSWLSSHLRRDNSGADEAAPPPAARLMVIDGTSTGRSVGIGTTPLVIGSADDCDLVLDDADVGPRHAQIVASGPETCTLTDLRSGGGILFGSFSVQEAALEVDDTFTLGQTTLCLQPAARALAIPPSKPRRGGPIVGESVAMRELFGLIEEPDQSQVSVLVEGETGTGKELVARALHDGSDRRDQPFVSVDCGSLSGSLLESALFGHVKGAFTGAHKARHGAFEQASSGSLFLDNVSALTIGDQDVLLHVLKTGKMRPVGAPEEQDVDVRILAACDLNLAERVAQGLFRPGLFYALAQVRVQIPPLRDRPEDILPIARAVLARLGFPVNTLSGAGVLALISHHWPGNVHELKNVLQAALTVSVGAEVFGDLHIEVGPPAPDAASGSRIGLPFEEAKQIVVDNFEQSYLQALVAQFPGGNLAAMALAARLDQSTLKLLLERHKLR